MRALEPEFLSAVSGAAYLTADYVEVVSPSSGSYQTMAITINPDGSLPKELQEMIDNGATWEQMAPFLMLYSFIKATHPELFS